MKRVLTLLCGIGLLLSALAHSEDAAPEPEFPYPKTTTQKINIEAPEKVDRQGGFYYKTDKPKNKPKSIQGVEQPKGVDEDGTYYYDTEIKKETATMEGVEKPIETDDEGGYYYAKPKKESKKEKLNKVIGEKPANIEADGTYVYNMNVDKANNMVSLKIGMYGPPKISAATENARGYNDVYTSSPSLIFNLDYDWKLYDNISLKFTTGVMTVQGKGQFVDTGNTIEPREKFQLFVFPNTVSFSYQMQIWNVQWITPYVDGGAGYFTFAEIRSDGQKTKLGGAPVLAAAAGLLFSVNKFQDGSSLQNDYGISQSWIDLQFKQILGLDSRKDFTSQMITLGFAVGF